MLKRNNPIVIALVIIGCLAICCAVCITTFFIGRAQIPAMVVPQSIFSPINSTEPTTTGPATGQVNPTSEVVSPTTPVTTAKPIVTTVTKYTYSAIVVEYEPSPNEYLGFKVCEQGGSSCTVYGFYKGIVSKAAIGDHYQISFEGTKNCTAATGTSYCLMDGNSSVKKE